MKTFNVIKKNRKYFEAAQNGYKCKILIDGNSENLSLGQQELEVDDISVRSKYGVDLIYKLSASIDAQKDAGICTLKTDFYNAVLVEECHRLGGKWDGEAKAWIFSGLVENEVEALDEKYNSPLVGVEITATSELNAHTGPLYLSGFKIATATGRDSGAKLADGIAFISGRYTSSGSMKNWYSKVSEGSVFRMQVPELCIQELAENNEIEVRRL